MKSQNKALRGRKLRRLASITPSPLFFIYTPSYSLSPAVSSSLDGADFLSHRTWKCLPATRTWPWVFPPTCSFAGRITPIKSRIKMSITACVTIFQALHCRPSSGITLYGVRLSHKYCIFCINQDSVGGLSIPEAWFL